MSDFIPRTCHMRCRFFNECTYLEMDDPRPAKVKPIPKSCESCRIKLYSIVNTFIKFTHSGMMYVCKDCNLRIKYDK